MSAKPVPTLLAAALPIVGDPYCRLMGVLISVDGHRCITQLIKDIEEAREFLRSPVYRAQFKDIGFDLSQEPVRWVEAPATDIEYLKAVQVFAQDFTAAKAGVAKKQAEAKAAPNN